MSQRDQNSYRPILEGGMLRAKLMGDKQLQDRMERLDLATRKAIERFLLAEASAPIVDAVRSAAPVRTTDLHTRSKRGRPAGNMQKSVGFVVRAYKRATLFWAYIGPKWPKGAHGHFAERGTQDRVDKAGHFRG